jgi:two-component system LytT family response regulator
LSLRVLIADDDIGMRLVLKKAIEKFGGFTIIGEAEDGDAALRLFDRLRPDVMFLDVEMPMISGVECAKKIADINPKTVIIFATAHDEYMTDAFEVYAFDYLVKPFKLERLNQTLKRIKIINDVKLDDAENKTPNLTRTPEKLMIRNKEGMSLVDMEDIILIQREDRSTVIYTLEDRFTTSEGLSELGEKLNRDLFFRCHKSYIINLSAVSKIFPYGRWTYIIKLKGTEKDALLTHDKYEEMQKLFK